MLRRPYQFAVYKIFSRRVVSACHLGIVIAGCFIIATAANWLFHAVTSSSSVAIHRDFSTQRNGEPNEAALNYGVVIDCGSSGSRVFVYCWPPHNGEPHQLLNIQLFHDSNGNPAVMKTEPGEYILYVGVEMLFSFVVVRKISYRVSVQWCILFYKANF